MLRSVYTHCIHIGMAVGLYLYEVVQVTRLQVGQPRKHGSIPGRGKRFFTLLQDVQTGFQSHTASFSVVIGGPLLEGRGVVKLTTHLHDEDKNISLR